jgi:hexosaminidase
MITFLSCAIAIQGSLPLVPLPQRIDPGQGTIELRNPVITATDASLAPLAEVLAEEIESKTGLRPTVSANPTRSGITLRLKAGGSPESYRIDVASGVTISAPTLKGISWGSVSLLQAIEVAPGHLRIPRQHIADQPAHPYRGLMIDVARRYHSIDVLKQCVELCRLYKLGYLQLHLSDDQSFTFPSRAFPLINTQNQHGGPSYTLAELKGLVRFADYRGVTIIPEMDIPGHSATLVRTMPDLFKIKGTKPYEHHASINFVNPAVLQAVDTLIGEMCDVFHSSPYFHMGGDEADISLADQHPDFQAAFKELGLPDKSQQELYRRFLNQVNAMVKKRGKKLIVWEGFGRNPASKFPIDKDILVMEFENAYYLPTDLLKDGYSLVNASWTPLYVVNRHVWPARKVYEWDLSQFGKFSNLYPTTGWFNVPNASRVQGAQVCSWEGPEESEIENLRRLVPAMAERTWSSRTAPYSDFEARMKMTDALLEKLVHPVSIEAGPLDAVDPSGYDVPCFSKPRTVNLRPARNGSVRFTTDGKPPTFASPEYIKPIELTQTTTIRAAIFGANPQRIGYESAKTFYYVPPHLPNLATGKKVISSGGTQGPQTPDLAVDDNLDLASSWWAAPGPQWLQVDLGSTHAVDRIEVFPYWDGRRYYAYTVEVSEDGLMWTTVADRSTNTKPASSQGDEIRFVARRVRFVKVNMLHGSANEGVHLVELRVWPAKAP